MTVGKEFRPRISADIEDGGWLQMVVIDAKTGEELASSAKLQNAAQLTDHPLPIAAEGKAFPKRLKLKFIFSKARLYSFSI